MELSIFQASGRRSEVKAVGLEREFFMKRNMKERKY